MEIIDDMWFSTSEGVIGIVVIEDEVTQERRALIGVASGHDMKLDTTTIVAWGNPFSVAAAARIITQLQGLAPLLTLGSGKHVYMDGKSFDKDEAHEIIIRLTQTWGTDFEKQALKDLALGLRSKK